MKGILTRRQLEKLTTKRLLAYKRSFMGTNETPDWETNGWSKASPEWKNHLALIKEILGTREHVEK